MDDVIELYKEFGLLAQELREVSQTVVIGSTSDVPLTKAALAKRAAIRRRIDEVWLTIWETAK